MSVKTEDDEESIDEFPEEKETDDEEIKTHVEVDEGLNESELGEDN